MKPGTVSLEKLTKRRTPADDRRLEQVERGHQVVAEDDVRRVVDRLRDRGGVDDRVAAARERVRGAGVGEVGLPVVLGLAADPRRGPRRAASGRSRARRSPPAQRRDERAADLAVRAGDEDPHRYVTASATTGRAAAQEVEVAALVRLQHVLLVQPAVAALVLALRRLPGRPARARARPRRRAGRARAPRRRAGSGRRSRRAPAGRRRPTPGATCRTTAPYEVPLMRASEMRTRSVTPCFRSFAGIGRCPHSGIPGAPTGPAFSQHHHAESRRRRGRDRRRAPPGRGCPRRRPRGPRAAAARVGGARSSSPRRRGRGCRCRTTRLPPAVERVVGRPDHVAVDDLGRRLRGSRRASGPVTVIASRWSRSAICAITAGRPPA